MNGIDPLPVLSQFCLKSSTLEKLNLTNVSTITGLCSLKNLEHNTSIRSLKLHFQSLNRRFDQKDQIAPVIEFTQSCNTTLEKLTLTFSTSTVAAVSIQKTDELSEKTKVKMPWSKLKHYVMYPNYIDHAELNQKETDLLGKLIRAQLE